MGRVTRRRIGRMGSIAVAAVLGASCSAETVNGPDPTDAAGTDDPGGTDTGGRGPIDAGFIDAGFIDAGRADSGPPVGPPDATVREDDAEVVREVWPDRLRCGATQATTVTIRNTGSATWTRAAGYKLGGVGDSDPLHPGEARVWLSDVDSVPPGGTYAFNVALVGPSAVGTYTSRWQMVHEGVRWFGAIARHDVTVDCPAAPDAGPPDAGPPDAGPLPTTLDLHLATITNNPPDLADWPITTTITAVDFQYMGMDGIHVEFSKRDGPGSWPDVTPPGWGGSLEYTLGLAEYIGGHWYASAAVQFWRGLPASGGNVAEDVVSMAQCTAFGAPSSCQVARNWYYDGRWGGLAGYQPATGEIIGVFVVAGNVRGVMDASESVRERSNVVLVRMPDFSGASDSF